MFLNHALYKSDSLLVIMFEIVVAKHIENIDVRNSIIVLKGFEKIVLKNKQILDFLLNNLPGLILKHLLSLFSIFISNKKG
mgnify:CR=1 FL=1